MKIKVYFQSRAIVAYNRRTQLKRSNSQGIFSPKNVMAYLFYFLKI